MRRATLAMVIGMVLLVTMGISSLIPILPTLATAFGIELEDSWRIIASFALPGLLCTPFVGILADRYGRKRVLVPSLLLFAFGGLACAFADSYAELLFFRVIQGTGSAPIGLLYPTIIADVWHGDERIKAMSFASMALGMGTAISPALGGALGMISWRLPMLLPLSALLVAFLALRVPLMVPGKSVPFREYAAGLLQTVKARQTLVLLGLTLVTFTMLSGPIITCFPILAERLFKASPMESGFIIASASLASGVAAMGLPWLFRRISSQKLLLLACLFYSIAFCTIGAVRNLWMLLPPIFLYGLAQGMNIPLVSLLLAGQAAPEQRSSLMAVNAILLRLGQNIGPATFGTLAGLVGPSAAIAFATLLAGLMALLVAGTPLPSPLESRSKNISPLEIIPKE